MNIRWPKDQCIVCLSEGSTCIEHLIPKSLGGRLTSKLLCTSCNSRIGHELEKNAKSDPSILLAAQHLRTHIPELAQSVIEAHPHIGQSKSGLAAGYVKNNEFRVSPHTRDDGTIIISSDQAKNLIIKRLMREGYEPSPIEEAVAVLENASLNQPTQITPTLQTYMEQIHSIEPDLSKAPLMNPLVPAKIAFEFIACHIGTAVYGEIPQLAQIRNLFQTLEFDNSVVKVERLTSNKYDAFHGILFESNKPYIKIRIVLFGWLVFRVHFLQLSIGGQRTVYTHRLDTLEESADVLGL